MEKPQILKEDVSGTVYELVDPSEVDAVLQKGLLPTHCVFIDNHRDYQEETEIESGEKSGEARGYVWQYNETIALLNLIEQHYDAIQHARKRQLIWKNISHELQSQNCTVDAATCHRKWRNLIRSYNAIRQNGSSGKIVKFQFYNEVHNILRKRTSDKIQEHVERKQTDTHNHVANCQTEKAEESKIKYSNSANKKYNGSTKRKYDEISEPNTSSYTSKAENPDEPETEVVITYVEKKSRATQTASCIAPIRARVRKRKTMLLNYITLQQQYFERDRLMQRNRIKEQQEESRAKERRFQEKLLLKREQLELDKKKTELFEQYLNLKMQGKN